MKTTVILVTFNGEAFLPRCLESLLGQDPPPALVAVDNGSSDGSLKILQKFSRENSASGFQLIALDENTGFTRGVNLAVRKNRTEPDFYFLLNQDAWLDSSCLNTLEESMRQHPEAGVLGPRILYPDGQTIQHAGAYLEEPRMQGLHYGHHEPEGAEKYAVGREVDFVTGAAMMIRRKAIGDRLPFNEVFSPGYYEDVELCQRLAEEGWTTRYEARALAFHEESSSFATRRLRLRLAHRNRMIFLADRLQEPQFRHAFLEAEGAFLRENAGLDELRAIRGGIVDVLVKLPALLEQRLGSSESTGIIRKILMQLYQDAADGLDAAFPLRRGNGGGE